MDKENLILDAERERRLEAARRIVVKLGTSTVTAAEGQFSVQRVGPIVRSIASLMKSSRQVVLVSSGAIGLGRGWLGLHPSRLYDLVTKQACAAVGQSLLMDAYKSLFSACSLKIAQVLLTEEDFSNWGRYSNLRHTMERLLGLGVVPIINQNDTVSTAEIEPIGHRGRAASFSDNDRLAALVMSGLEADALVLVTNVDGLLRKRPSATNAHSQHTKLADLIPLVSEITPDLRALAAGPSSNGRGGMVTKLEAAEIAMECGGIVVIANGQNETLLDRIFAGERIGTAFLSPKRIRGKRRWIAHAAGVRGRVVVDEGAQEAIMERKASLLTSGIVRIEGHFAPMDVISILDHDGREFARGIANYASMETQEEVTGERHVAVMDRRVRASRILVRRDNIVLLRNSQ
jgi:glutamate 5-kinase